MVYRLVSSGTIEEKLMELKARKGELFRSVMEDDGLLSAPLTADDIKALLEAQARLCSPRREARRCC